MSGLEQWGLQVVLWFQSWRNDAISVIAQFFHYAGSEDAYLVVLPVIYWCVDEVFGRRLTFFFVFNSWLNSMLKDVLARPRPYEISSEVKPVVLEPSRGVPSGHAQNATALFGMIALRVKKSWVTWLAVAYILLTAISRLVVGVHFPHDVIGGIVVGLMLIALYAWAEPRMTKWVNDQPLAMQIGTIVAICTILYVIHPLLVPTSDPESSGMVAIGALLGGGIGVALETRYVRFSARGEMWKRTVRFLIGAAVLIGLRFGLKAAFEGLEPVAIFRVLRYAIIGLWLAYAAPWVFVRFNLAETKRSDDI